MSEEHLIQTEHIKAEEAETFLDNKVCILEIDPNAVVKEYDEAAMSAKEGAQNFDRSIQYCYGFNLNQLFYRTEFWMNDNCVGHMEFTVKDIKD